MGRYTKRRVQGAQPLLTRIGGGSHPVVAGQSHSTITGQTVYQDVNKGLEKVFWLIEDIISEVFDVKLSHHKKKKGKGIF